MTNLRSQTKRIISGLLFLFVSISVCAKDSIEVDFATSPKVETPVHSLVSLPNIDEIVPTDIPNGASGDTVQTKILDHSLSTLFRKATVKHKNIAKVAEAYTKGLELNTEMSFSGSSPDSVQHKFSLETRLLESKAQLKYTGLVNAAVSYEGVSGSTKIEVAPEIEDGMSVLISQAINEKDSKSYVQFRLNY